MVSAIVPAHNEAPRITDALTSLCSHPDITEVVVVNDGSTDETAAAAKRFNVKCLTLPRRAGKGRALAAGISAARGDILFFADADIQGLSHETITMMVEKVSHGLDMFVAIYDRPYYRLPWVLRFTPHLGGQRTLTRRLWDAVPEEYKSGFGIESALNYYAKRHGRGFQYQTFPDLKHVAKENKFGWRRGLLERLAMAKEIAVTDIKLFFGPDSDKRRLLAR